MYTLSFVLALRFISTRPFQVSWICHGHSAEWTRPRKLTASTEQSVQSLNVEGATDHTMGISTSNAKTAPDSYAKEPSPKPNDCKMGMFAKLKSRFRRKKSAGGARWIKGGDAQEHESGKG